jgi:hypothetical protein
MQCRGAACLLLKAHADCVPELLVFRWSATEDAGCHDAVMAILFELVVNFGTDKEAANAVANLVRRASHIAVHGVRVPFNEPLILEITRPAAYVEFSVHLRWIGSDGAHTTAGTRPALAHQR